MPNQLEIALSAGFKAGWYAAWKLLGDRMEEALAEGERRDIPREELTVCAADILRACLGTMSNPPPVPVVQVRDGETPEEAALRATADMAAIATAVADATKA
jgi:hypothetical protein